MELDKLGGTALNYRNRDTLKSLKDIQRKINRLQGYDGCPNMQNEQQLLATFRYILSSPFDEKFGNLNPDNICQLLQQNGLTSRNLYYQNYESILHGWETPMYEMANRQDGTGYLRPTDHVRLEITPGGYTMNLASRLPGKGLPAVPNVTETVPASEKKIKQAVNRKPVQHVRKTKNKSVKIK